MKRLISLIIVAAMLALTIPFVVSAASSNYKIVLDVPETYNSGDKIIVTATVKDITVSGGISGVSFLLHYDKDCFDVSASGLAVTAFASGSDFAWDDLTKLDSKISNGSFVPADNGIINVEACDSGGSNGNNFKNAGAGAELVFKIEFTAKSTAKSDADFWIDASETECVVLNDSANGYTSYSGIAAGEKIEKTVVYDDPSDNPSSDDPSSDDPSIDDPSSDDPSTDDPSSDDPSTDDPSSDDPSSDDPSSDDPSDETEYTLGDVDGDEDVDADDYILLKRIFFGMAKLDKQKNPETALLRSDVYKQDGAITADDYILLKRVFFGMAKL